LVWRAANQLEALQAGIGEVVESDETLKQARDRGEKTRLLAVLLHAGGNKTWAADRLRISRTALQKVLRKHRLKPPIAR
jgi:transcriptional regulator with PAS, ATPase and Fis domain